MKTTPTPEQIAKLPAWAREHIKNLQRERDVSVRELNEYCDESTPSPFSTEANVCTGESQGPAHKTRYIQAHSIVVKWRGVELHVDANDYGNGGSGIRLQWSADDTGGDVALIPTSYQYARLVSVDDMRTRTHPPKTT